MRVGGEDGKVRDGDRLQKVKKQTNKTKNRPFDPSGFKTPASPGATGEETWVNKKGDTRS